MQQREMPIVFVGGDERSLAAGAWLAQRGLHVSIYGFAKSLVPAAVNALENPRDIAHNARAVVLPVPGPDDEGYVRVQEGPAVKFDCQFLSGLPEGTPVISGYSGEVLAAAADSLGVTVHEIMHRDDFALYNAVPTSEGAILEAMRRSTITLADSHCHVVGYGRCGKVQAQQLKGLNAHVTIVSRTAASRAEAQAMGFRVCSLAEWQKEVPNADFIFNTVPVQVLPRELLQITKPTVVIIDVASAPGGVDFEAARALQRDAVLTPGLPGKRAPRTAGIALAQVVLDIITSSSCGGE